MLLKRMAATKTVSFGTYRDLCICFESWWEVGGSRCPPPRSPVAGEIPLESSHHLKCVYSCRETEPMNISSGMRQGSHGVGAMLGVPTACW